VAAFNPLILCIFEVWIEVWQVCYKHAFLSERFSSAEMFGSAILLRQFDDVEKLQ
jgi:hypothetical protein